MDYDFVTSMDMKLSDIASDDRMHGENKRSNSRARAARNWKYASRDSVDKMG